MKQTDIDILRKLGEQINNIGNMSCQEETKNAWMALNNFKPVRPMVLIDELPWHEMNFNGELTNMCEDNLCRNIETELRRKLFQWKYFACDYVMQPHINVYRPIFGLDYGMKIEANCLMSDKMNNVSSHIYLDQLADEKDIAKITINDLHTDDEAFSQTLYTYHKIFDDVAPLKAVNGQVFGHFMDEIVMWHGIENLMYDLIDRPEFIHLVMRRLTDASLHYIDELERLKLFEEKQDYIHCSGAFYDWTKKEVKRNSALNSWTFGTSQPFSMVSEAMHEEFESKYLSEFFARFGQVYYGCCEPLHNKINMIRKLPNVSKISISPWSDAEIAAKNIHGDYVLSSKPNPARLAAKTLSLGDITCDINSIIESGKRHSTPIEFILKDVSTVNYEPKRIFEWANCVMKLVRGCE